MDMLWVSRSAIELIENDGYREYRKRISDLVSLPDLASELNSVEIKSLEHFSLMTICDMMKSCIKHVLRKLTEASYPRWYWADKMFKYSDKSYRNIPPDLADKIHLSCARTIQGMAHFAKHELDLVLKSCEENLELIPLLPLIVIGSNITTFRLLLFPVEAYNYVFEALPRLPYLKTFVSVDLLPFSSLPDSLSIHMSEIHHLTILILWYVCTDDVVESVTKNSPLETLDVMMSRNVSNGSIPHIINCRTLKQICVFKTSIDNDGLTTILTEFPDAFVMNPSENLLFF